MARPDDTDPPLGSTFEALLGALAQAPHLPVPPVIPGDYTGGRRIGRYAIVELLGRGGMGVVYRAHDEMLGRDVALKVIFTGGTGSPVDRFRREVVALASVRHENVVAVHDAGVDNGLPYVVLDLVEGQTLRERLRAGPIAVADVDRLAHDLNRGLGAAHAVGIVHRDLKPENVLIDERGTARLVDFGLARLVERTDPDLASTEAGMFLGTAHYMAPEQVRGERVDHRADYFALGAVLYEALTGRRAFEGASRADAISAVLRDQPSTEPALLSDERARRLLGVALRCLEKSPAGRFQSATEVREALDAPRAVLPQTAEIPQTRYATSSGAHIAYQVVSPPGPPTLVLLRSLFSNVEMIWESPRDVSWIRAHAAFTHFIHYDRRGVGMSDSIGSDYAFDDSIEDLRSVLDAERVEQTFLGGLAEGGATSLAFAAKYPDRVRGLILINSCARLLRGDDYPHGRSRPEWDALIDDWVARWGTPDSPTARLLAPSGGSDPEFAAWFTRFERHCASPGTVRQLAGLLRDLDVRALLGQLRCPVLVMHRRDNPAFAVEHGRYLAAHIPDVRYVELEGRDHAPFFGDAERPLALVREFITSVAAADPPLNRSSPEC